VLRATPVATDSARKPRIPERNDNQGSFTLRHAAAHEKRALYGARNTTRLAGQAARTGMRLPAEARETVKGKICLQIEPHLQSMPR